MSYAIIRNTKPFYTIQSLQNLQNARKCGIINIMAIVMSKPL